MTNLALARAFFEIADLMDLNGDSSFRANAYRRGARAIEGLPEDIRNVHSAGKTREIPGIGPVLADKIDEWLSTGSIKHLEALRETVPQGVVEMTNIAGVGTKLARRFYVELGIGNIEELEKACRQRRIRTLKGLGARTEWNILRGIEAIKARGKQVPLGVALLLARSVQAHLEHFPVVDQVELSGALRRREEMVDEIDLVVSTPDPPAVLELFAGIREAEGAMETQPHHQGKMQLKAGPCLEVVARVPDEFIWALWQTTGSKRHVEQLKARADSLNIGITKEGIESNGSVLRPASEADIYHMFDLPLIPPELRQGRGEVEAAALGTLPKLVELGDIRGDLHCHSRWSDGVLTVKEMALAARAKGYEYLAICDHSQSLRIANGLDPHRLRLQHAEIRRVEEEIGFRVLSGIEVDILADGSLDLPDDILAERDIVVASIHSGFRQDRKQLTDRVLKAMENPHVDVVGHPTGRLLGRRAPYSIDMDQIIRRAAATGTVLEINASPDRLDINEVYARQAMSSGVRMAVNTDAHSQAELDNMHLGVSVARRAWLTSEHVINTWPWAHIRELFASS